MVRPCPLVRFDTYQVHPGAEGRGCAENGGRGGGDSQLGLLPVHLKQGARNPGAAGHLHTTVEILQNRCLKVFEYSNITSSKTMFCPGARLDLGGGGDRVAVEQAGLAGTLQEHSPVLADAGQPGLVPAHQGEEISRICRAVPGGDGEGVLTGRQFQLQVRVGGQLPVLHGMVNRGQQSGPPRSGWEWTRPQSRRSARPRLGGQALMACDKVVLCCLW